jgi:hypothetical protein
MALDSVATNHGFISNGVSFTSGKVGAAFNLSGSGRVAVGNNSALNPTNAITI